MSSAETVHPALSRKLVGSRLLVIENNESLRKLLHRILSSLGIAPVKFSDLSDGYAAALEARRQGSPFSAVILDCNCLASTDAGSDLEINFGADTPVIILATAIQLSRASELRCSSFVTRIIKPLKPHELMRVLDYYLAPSNPDINGAKSLESEKLSSVDADRRHIRVLVAEDNSVNQKLISRTLGKKGITVVIAENGKQAVEAFEKGSFDLILMDVQMPEMDGITATRMIRDMEKGKGKRIPIVAMTAHAFHEAQAMCIEAGMDSYLSKPVSGSRVLEIIDSLVKDDSH